MGSNSTSGWLVHPVMPENWFGWCQKNDTGFGTILLDSLITITYTLGITDWDFMNFLVAFLRIKSDSVSKMFLSKSIVFMNLIIWQSQRFSINEVTYETGRKWERGKRRNCFLPRECTLSTSRLLCFLQ